MGRNKLLENIPVLNATCCQESFKSVWHIDQKNKVLYRNGLFYGNIEKMDVHGKGASIELEFPNVGIQNLTFNKQLRMWHDEELNAFLYEYGTLAGEWLPAGDELHIRSIVNSNKTNKDFIHGFAEIVKAARESVLFSELHVIEIENDKLRRYLLSKYDFEVVSATRVYMPV